MKILQSPVHQHHADHQAFKMPRPKRTTGRKDRKHEISWSKNPEWTEALVAILVDNEAIRNGLFHDPKKCKNPSGHSKDYWHMRLAEGIFQEVFEGWEESDELKKDYAASVGNYLGRLKSEYKEKVRRLKETGAGEDGDEQELDEIERATRKQSAEDNLLARYRSEWPWWDDLHAVMV